MKQKDLERRRRRRRLLLLAAIAALIALAIWYLQCNGGFGFGGGDGLGTDQGDGTGEGSARPAVELPAARCKLRLAASGITVDGEAMTQAEAVAACKAAGGAEVVVTGDARKGDWEALRSALDEAGVAKSLTEP